MHSAMREPSAAYSGSKPLSRAEFALRFAESSRLFWCIAAAILADRHGADDVVQEAAMTALGKLDEFDADTSFKAWMSQIVRFIALNHARLRRRRDAALEGEAPRLATPDRRHASVAGAVDSRGRIHVDQGEFDDDVVRALAALDETARACLLLRVVLELPYREISTALNIPEGSAMSHVHRARRAMRDRLASTAAGSASGRSGNPS
jgi:RNA polymerase sigma-70 factor, ECF subfamily